MLHLDLLLLLRREDTRSWTGEAAALALQTETDACLAALDDIARMQLAWREDSGTMPAFRFHPATPELARTVTSIVSAYEQKPVTLIRAIYESASSARRFADAFRLRDKEKSDG
jgi:hypothetical protein